MFPGFRSSLMFSGFGLKLPASGFKFYFYSLLCCPLCFQGLPQTRQCFLVFGNLSLFKTPFLGQVSILDSFVCLFIFIFCFTSFQRQWATFLGALCPPPAFRSCFVKFAQHSNVLLMNLWGRKWFPHPIPPPS